MNPYSLASNPYAAREPEGRNMALLAEAIARIIGMSPTMFTRVNFGSRYIGGHWQMLFAAVFRSGGPGLLACLFLIAALTQARNAAPLMLFLLGAFAFSVAHRFIGW